MHAVWQACVRVSVRPPGLPASWDEATAPQQAMILGFNQIEADDEYRAQAKVNGMEIKD